MDPLEAAKALGLCRRADATGKAWGVIDAHYVKPDGSPLGAAPAVSWGVLPSFGAASPISGAAMIALSSGAARASNQANYVAPTGGLDKTYSHSLPAGFPKPMPACNGLPLANAVYDGIALEVHLRAPINAKSLSFAHQFFTTDYPDGVCNSFDDVFAVLISPKPASSPDGNLVLDAQGGALTTNSTSLTRACAPGTHNGLSFPCPLGDGPLAGTGFEGHGSTGWLRSRVPVTGGAEMTLRFAIWDSGDHSNDSTVLLDDFRFSTDGVPAVTTSPQ